MLLLLSTLLALVLGEGFARLRSQAFGPTTNPHYVLADPLLGWRYRPGVEVEHHADDFAVKLTIGASGFRAQPSLGVRPAEIVLCGDSLAFGWGVADDQTAAAQLEQLLGLPVWNLGVSGYSSDQQYLLLREQAWLRSDSDGPKPRALVVLYCPNDAEEVARRWMYGKEKPYFSGEPPQLLLTNVPIQRSWLEQHSHLFRALRKRWRELETVPLTPAEQERAQRVVVEFYARMQQLVEPLGCKFWVAHAGEGWLAAALAQRGLSGVDLAPALSQAALHAPIRFDHDPHWTAHGQAAVAGALAQVLR